MELTPELDAFLAAMEYPATKDDLMRESARDGVSADGRALLAALPDIGFSNRWRIRRELARTTSGATPATASGTTAPQRDLVAA